jgi:hypothetical protein
MDLVLVLNVLMKTKLKGFALYEMKFMNYGLLHGGNN